ncbi:MAG: hypothetical protein QW303_02705 [Nitrososphaerota archaeon]
MLLTLNSRNRRLDSISSSNCTIDLKNPLSGSIAKFKQFSAPNTVYNIRQNVNDLIVWRRGSINYSYQVIPGKWNITDLIANIEGGMNSIDPNSYTVSYNSITFKITINGVAAFILNWNTNPSSGTSMWRELGFTKADTAEAVSQTSVNCIQLNFPMTLLIRIDELGIGGVTDQGFWYTFQMPLVVGSGDIQEYTEKKYYPQQVSITMQKVQTTQLKIQLYYDDGTSLSLNGADWTMTLEIN